MSAKDAHYYEAHEAEYVKRLAAGHVAWDAGAYDDFSMRPFVARSLERSKLLGRTGRNALELGCGTGPLSCQLAAAGFDVLGIDISPTAIALAREMAARRKLSITFEVADVCRHPLAEGAFDLIVDGHLLHCIVFEQERQRLLENVRRALKPDDGEFWVETMLLEHGHEPDPQWHLDARGVVWAPLSAGRGEHFLEAVRRDGAWWLPQRLIARSRVALLADLAAAGLRVIESECYPPPAPHMPGGLRARCVRADGKRIST
jgi:SAM-dependent methyltransferase